MQRLRVVLAALVLGTVSIGAAPPSVLIIAAPSNADAQRVLDEYVRDHPGTGVIAGIIDRGKVTILKADTQAGRVITSARK